MIALRVLAVGLWIVVVATTLLLIGIQIVMLIRCGPDGVC
jgi:hypothetical protein